MASLCRTVSIVALAFALTAEASHSRYHKSAAHHRQHREETSVVISMTSNKEVADVATAAPLKLADVETEIRDVWKHKDLLQAIGKSIDSQNSMLKQSEDLERVSMDGNSLAEAKDEEDETRKLLKNSQAMLATGRDAAVKAAKEAIADMKVFLVQEQHNEKAEADKAKGAQQMHAQAVDDKKTARGLRSEADKQLQFFLSFSKGHAAKESAPAFLQQSRRPQIAGQGDEAKEAKVEVADRMALADIKALVAANWDNRDRIRDLKSAVRDAHALVKDEMALVSKISGGASTETIVEDQKSADTVQAHSVKLFKQLRVESVESATKALKASTAAEKFAGEQMEESEKALADSNIASLEAKEHVEKAEKLMEQATKAMNFFEKWDVIKDPKGEHIDV